MDDKDSGMCQVISTYKVINKKVPRVVADRKKWRKFGASNDDGPGPNVKTTYVTDEVQIQFLQNKSGESQEHDNIDDKKSDPMKAYASRGHCRICKGDDHWSVNCPYKVIFKIKFFILNNMHIILGNVSS